MNVTGVIPVGQTVDVTNISPCTGGGIFIGCTNSIENSCIIYVDNTANNIVGTC